MPSRSSVVWKSERVVTFVRPSPRSSNVAVSTTDVAGHPLPLEGLLELLGRLDHAVGAAERGLPVSGWSVTKRQSPPTRTSILSTVVVPAPPHHCGISSGSTKAWKTRSRGRVEDALRDDLAVALGA